MGSHASPASSYLAPPATGTPLLDPPQTTTWCPVHTMMGPCRADGAPSALMVVQASTGAGAYRAPVARPASPLTAPPPHTTTCAPVQAAPARTRAVGAPTGS